MRKEFENMVVSGDLIPDLFSGCIMYANRVKMVADCFCDGRYRNDFLQSTFEAFSLGWQASREAMSPIKLPKTMKNTQEQSCYYYNDAIDECKEAIEQAGYKVEP